MQSESEESVLRFQRLAEIYRTCVWELDPEGRFTYCSRLLKDILGYEASEVLGRPFSDFVVLDQQDRIAEMMESLRWARQPEFRARWQLVHRDGHIVESESVCVPVIEADGMFAGFWGVHRDVTRETELEAALRHSQKMEGIGQLAGGVAHDFNNLLTTILGACNLVTDEIPPGSPAHDDIDLIREAGNRAARLTQQLLAFSRKQILCVKRLNVNDVVRGMEDLLRRTLGEDVDLALRTEQNLPDVESDADQLQQVILHLAVNAREAMVGRRAFYQPDLWSAVSETGHPPKRLEIVTSLARVDDQWADAHPGLAPGEYVTLSVSDSGEGIPEHVLPHIFEPFFTTKGVGEGSGLGLSTVYGIVKQMGGEVQVKSRAGVGSTFKILLPRATAKSSADIPVPSERATLSGSETLLVVEDDDHVRRLLVRMLKSYGYSTYEARHGAEALAFCREYPERVDLVITDMVMPHMTGKAFVEAARRERPEMKVLYMSGYSREDVVDGQTLGTDAAFVPKPFTRDQLGHHVRHLLDGQ